MKTSETTKGLSDALAKAQGIIQNPTKDGVNPHFKSKYATLESGLNVIRDVLSKNAISVSQATRMQGDVMIVDTRLSHGNEWIESEYPVIKFPARQQEIGSALTYARRYSLFAIVGVAGEDDDDATAATSQTPAPKKEASVKAILATLDSFAHNAEEVDKWWRDNMAELNKLPKTDLDEIIAACSAKKNAFLNAGAPK